MPSIKELYCYRQIFRLKLGLQTSKVHLVAAVQLAGILISNI